MFQSIYQDLRQQYQRGDIITRLIIVNGAVFVLINLVWIFLSLGRSGTSPVFDSILNFFLISDNWMHNLTHPWVFFTHMFMHQGFLHLLFNMLFLYWFGNIVKDFLGGQRILPVYLLGGLMGVVFYLITAPFAGPDIMHGPSYALGASAAVMAFVMAAAVTSPNYYMHLIFIGPVKLKYIAAVLIFLDLIGASGNYNTGGHFAHLGGVFFGWLFVTQLRKGTDLTLPTQRILDRVFSFFSQLFNRPQRPKPTVAYRNPKREKEPVRRQRRTRRTRGEAHSDSGGSHQEQIDAILDKIKERGYDSLSEAEREFLFNASKKKD